MPTIQKRNFFSGNVAHPGGAVTIAALLRVGGWGLNDDGSKSADSFVGDNVQFIPTTAMYVGWTDGVRDAAGVGVYKGAFADAGMPFNVTDYCRGPVLTDDVFVYSAAGQNMDLTFQSV